MGKPISFHVKWIGRFAIAKVANLAKDERQDNPTLATLARLALAKSDNGEGERPNFSNFSKISISNRQADNDAQSQAVNPNTTPAVDWQQADRAYQAHHWSCPICRAAGLGKGSMCDEGQRLHDAYEAAPMPEFGKAKAKQRVAPPLPAPARQPPRFTPRSDAEIDRLVMLHQQAMRVGLPDSNDTDKCLDAVMDAPLGMSACFACTHIRGSSPDRWRCAGRGHELAGSPLAREFVMHLHRCPAFQGVNP